MIIIYSILAFWLLWVFYVAVMHLKKVRDTVGLTPASKVFGYPTLFVGLVLDCLINITVCTVLFLDLPRETLVTARLQRYVRGDGWRKKAALWFGVELLNDFDPSGNHLD